MKNNQLTITSNLINQSKYAKFQDFHNLMRFRIRDILLVSSMYDSYIFEEDGRLYELIRREYQGLNLSHSPELEQVSSGEEAIELAKTENRFNLIIATQHIEDMHTITFAKKIREAGINIPMVLLGYDNREMIDLIHHKEISVFDKIFIWQGDFRIILGIIKYIEDKFNIEYDTKRVGVQTIILIEDNIRFYSSFLPIIYTELVKQAQSLISEGINLSHKFLRMRARPKIILCSNYEEAWEYFEKYQETILGIVSDIDFKRNGKQDPRAGIVFAKNVKAKHPDIPILLQSNVPENEEAAYSIKVSFILKDSPTLLQELRKFMTEQFSFGDFIFRTPDGVEVGRARNLRELERQLGKVPEESISYHAGRNHFSTWLKARTEFWLAHKLRPRKVTDYKSVNELRLDLIDSVSEFRKSRQRGVILDFKKETFDKFSSFARIGGGSIGGKARGLGFINNLLANFEFASDHKDVDIFVPPLVVLGTDVFDQFLDDNDLQQFALRCKNDYELLKKFLGAARFPFSIIKELMALLELMREPIAVRSSSLLEDSQGQPFAGVYDTFMLPNNHPDLRVRLAQLLNTIRQIYASTFSNKAKDYIKVTSYRLEEEKMAVIIQRTVGSTYGQKYYPEFSGVAKSYNFYPSPPLKSGDGIVSVALGLGKTIVEGGATIRFCPKYPNNMLNFGTIEDQLKYSQQEFFAINLNTSEHTFLSEENVIKKFNIADADEDGTLPLIASTYSHQNHAVYDGTSRDGSRLFTLAPILKHKLFPLPQIIDKLLEIGSWGMGSPVEIEFAVNLNSNTEARKQFGLLQMRPLVISNELEELDLSGFVDEDLLCRSNNAMGNGVISDIKDILYVDINSFDRSKSREAASQVASLNSKLNKEGLPYLLIGVGRWGSLDHWLGIPVTWEQISGAKAIIETNFKDFDVTPSQGSHFFQNLTSFKVGYFTVHVNNSQNFVDWNWLNGIQPVEDLGLVKHLKLKTAIIIKLNGQENSGIIVKAK
ncbi:MAG: PEP/pyruvate-binding domain-containing protein [Bacteroidota bacterium]